MRSVGQPKVASGPKKKKTCSLKNKTPKQPVQNSKLSPGLRTSMKTTFKKKISFFKNMETKGAMEVARKLQLSEKNVENKIGNIFTKKQIKLKLM